MLPDITQYYNDNEPLDEPRYGYKRKRTDEVEIIVIAECHVCGSLMTEECEVITYNGETFCGAPCEEEYKRRLEDGEL